MTASTALYYAPMVIFTALVLVICVYGLFLALKLRKQGEWQWLALPFLALPVAIASAVISRLLQQPASPDSLVNTFIWGYSVLIIVSLLSALAVYWLMQNYRKQTGFVHFYAAIYFFNAIVQAGFMIAILVNHAGAVHFFVGAMQILAIYAMVVTLSGVSIMRLRLKQK